MERVETHYLKNSSPFFTKMKNFCHLSKNLYNHANYLVRQSYFDPNSDFLYYKDVYDLVKESIDYKSMPTAQSAQQTLRILDKSWKRYFKALEDYKEHPEKYKVKYYMHKASRKIVDYCVENQVDTIVIGENVGWKQNCNLSSITNQNFV